MTPRTESQAVIVKLCRVKVIKTHTHTSQMKSMTHVDIYFHTFENEIATFNLSINNEHVTKSTIEIF